MALPKLNETIKYEMEIPSMGKMVTYRPYLVKEEKVLLQAFESQDQKQAMRAMVDTVCACVFDDLDSTTLTTFDVEYMFTQVRAKSVGESSDLSFGCQNEGCEGRTDVSVDLTKIQLDKPDVNNIIELTPNISIELHYPSYVSFLNNYTEGMSETQFAFAMLEDCIVAVLTDDERINMKDVSKKEVKEFIDSMTAKQFETVGNYLASAPKMTKEVEYTCSECGHENKVNLEGLADFF